jgi:hypothetical protein
MQLSITTNFPDVQRKLAALQDDIARKATARALNRTVEQAKTAMSKEIRQEFVLPAAKVNAALRIRRAQAAAGLINLQAMLESPAKRGRSLNLANFGARQTKKGVSFKVKRAGSRVVIPGSFLINGGKTLMIRVGKQRMPIKALQTIDVAQMFNTKRINAKVINTIKARFPVIFEREAAFYLAKFNAK